MQKRKRKTDRTRSTTLTPQFRSGAVARMTLIPVATLRVWEQRYRAVSPSTTESGHRLYDLAGVQRLLLLRQLTQQGHAIGSLAQLQTEQLQALVGQHVGIARGTSIERRKPGRALRLVVIGRALAERLRRPEVAQHAGNAIEVMVDFASLADALPKSRPVKNKSKGTIDALIWESPGLQPSSPPELAAARDAWAASQVAVVYRFAGSAAKRVFSDAGVLLLHDQANDQGLGTALALLAARVKATQEPAGSTGHTATAGGTSPKLVVPATPRRYDDTLLTRVAALPSTSACECPRHVAELLMQIANFESYSADCASRNQNDAQLHAHLNQVAGVARQLFESAIEAVASYEGIALR
jgi:DNA-binding transcriptional MerR regulator